MGTAEELERGGGRFGLGDDMNEIRDQLAKIDEANGDDKYWEPALQHAIECARTALSTFSPLPVAEREWQQEIAALKLRIDTRLNDCLCEMKPNYDDSVTGFNEAWDVVRKVFADTAKLPAPPLLAEQGEKS
jgi:hypothetical protein